ncbi:GATA zinc finger domain-containing protein 4-like [Nymphalis io]|uniref:GATA zinc finger domain-containing protein 4-like n=1 Tax=Inachis io TaxID=171585 RepID=UPI0021690A86|nr:GATA zinc finger domain-containing protein 4-like [Nymphalis io]
MGTTELIIFAFAFGIIGVCQGQYYGRMRGLNSIHKDTCTCSCEDLASLIALARALEDKEVTYQYPTPPPPPPPTTTTTNPTPCLSNFEELIMKLVNALVYTATETTKNSCHCPRSTSVPATPNSNSYYSNSDEGLINIDVLNSKKNNNVLDLDVANQNVVGVGLGGNNYNGAPSTGPKPSGHNPTGQNPKGQQPTGGKYQPTSNTHSDEGLINLDLLNPNKNNNVLDLDIGKQDVLGVGLGGNGGGGAVPNTNNNSYTNNAPNAGEGLINADLLNPKKENNVLDLDVGKQTLVGVGLGN